MQTHTLTIPWPPSTNTLYATVRGRRVLSAKGRAYKHTIFELFHRVGGVFVDGLVWVVFRATMPDRRRRDLDNLLKIMQDSMTGLAWKDDSLIDDVRVIRSGVAKPGHVVVEYGPCS